MYLYVYTYIYISIYTNRSYQSLAFTTKLLSTRITLHCTTAALHRTSISISISNLGGYTQA